MVSNFFDLEKGYICLIFRLQGVYIFFVVENYRLRLGWITLTPKMALGRLKAFYENLILSVLQRTRSDGQAFQSVDKILSGSYFGSPLKSFHRPEAFQADLLGSNLKNRECRSQREPGRR